MFAFNIRNWVTWPVSFVRFDFVNYYIAIETQMNVICTLYVNFNIRIQNWPCAHVRMWTFVSIDQKNDKLNNRRTANRSNKKTKKKYIQSSICIYLAIETMVRPKVYRSNRLLLIKSIDGTHISHKVCFDYYLYLRLAPLSCIKHKCSNRVMCSHHSSILQEQKCLHATQTRLLLLLLRSAKSKCGKRVKYIEGTII